jgi:hypothetical protein
MPSARSAKKQEFVQHSICIESLQSDVQVNEYVDILITPWLKNLQKQDDLE